jgi:hypothetical protein
MALDPPEETPSVADVAPASSPPSRRPPRRSGAARAALRVLLGLALGAGLTEGLFRYRDGGAFPLVNVYEPDELRGVRLAAGGAVNVGRRGERVTHVRVNADGYRGPAWPAPAPGEVLVVGDSLSFGLGVEEDEALPARLGAALAGPRVLDASVPTYGPPEYLVTLEQVLARRTPAAVVIVFNVMNDFAELDRPNTLRHAAVDGWAARVDGGAPPPAGSRFGELAVRRSHAAFAVWRWQRTREALAVPREPEPGLGELLALAGRVAGEARIDGQQRRDEEERAAAEAELEAAREQVVALVRRHARIAGHEGLIAREWDAYLRGDGDPADEIFPIYYGGCGGPGPRDRRGRLAWGPGARIRREVEAALRSFAALPTMSREASREIIEALARRDAAEERDRRVPDYYEGDLGLGILGYGYAPPAVRVRARGPLPTAAFLRRAKELTDARGARLVVLAAPLDAQVSKEARLRRELTQVEVGSLDALVAALAEDARAIGAVGVDPTPALAGLGEAVYLPDGHLSPAGHEVVARAVSEAMTGAR